MDLTQELQILETLMHVPMTKLRVMYGKSTRYFRSWMDV